MAISNGYSTLQEFKDYAFRGQEATDATDDAVIEDLVEAASRAIDRFTGRTFYARSETRLYDTPGAATLWLDDDLLTVTALTNGDGTAIAASSYVLHPANATPYYAVELLGTDGVWWQLNSDSQSPRRAIALEATWGYAAAAPDDVHLACLIVARDAYLKRYGDGDTGESSGAVTPDGVRLLPATFPRRARLMLGPYVKVT